MTAAGIIAEYNPFHKGHQYHLEQTKQQTGADCCAVVMSGDFVQRGTPAILDKYTRTRMALEGGADLVFELPCVYATASAELFSEAAVSFFETAGIVDSLCFGAEHASLPQLSLIARILQEEPAQYREFLSQGLKEGQSYPRAVYGALTRFFLESTAATASTIQQAYLLSKLLSSPNNILGIEYLKALLRTGSSIRPCCIERKGSSYHSRALTDELCSATAIRSILEGDSQLTLLSRYVTPYVYECLTNAYQVSFPIVSDDLSPLLDYCILSKKNPEDFADMTKELAQRMASLSPEPHTFEERADALKTKNITRTHINRALLHYILGITKEETASYKNGRLIPYVRILGFRQTALPLLTKLKKNCAVPIITKVADAKKLLPAASFQMFETDIRAAHLYRSLVYHKFHTLLPDEYRAGVIRL